LRTADLLAQTPKFETVAEKELKQAGYYKFEADETEAPFTISRDADATWILGGAKLEKLFKMTNLEHDESMMRFARQLRGMGVDDALRERGAKNGDLVRIGDFTFEFVE
ncbi:Obg family GTPase CgtA, partial [Ligilactobacillus agilis]